MADASGYDRRVAKAKARRATTTKGLAKKLNSKSAPKETRWKMPDPSRFTRHAAQRAFALGFQLMCASEVLDKQSASDRWYAEMEEKVDSMWRVFSGIAADSSDEPTTKRMALVARVEWWALYIDGKIRTTDTQGGVVPDLPSDAERARRRAIAPRRIRLELGLWRADAEKLTDSAVLAAIDAWSSPRKRWAPSMDLCVPFGVRSDSIATLKSQWSRWNREHR